MAANQVEFDGSVLTVEQVADRLGLSEAGVKRLLKEEKLKGFKIGKFWRTTSGNLNQFIADCQRAGNGVVQVGAEMRAKLRYNAVLRGKEAAPKAIDSLNADIDRVKQEIQVRDQLGRVPKISQLKSAVKSREEKQQRLEELPGILEDLSENAYPGMRALADEDPETLEALFTGEANNADGADNDA